MSRFEELTETVEAYQSRAAENYDRIRKLASELKEGFCAFLGSGMGVCVHLVPPAGPFQPRTDLNTAFSVPPRGFRPLGPVLFGMAVRVSKGTDWIRVVMHCHKQGDKFITWSYDRTCKIWRTETGEELLTLEGHRNVVYAIAFNNPWGNKIITGSFGTFPGLPY